MKEEDILKAFTPEQMAKLLIGARESSKRDKELIEWLLAEKYRLEDRIKELTGFK